MVFTHEAVPTLSAASRAGARAARAPARDSDHVTGADRYRRNSNFSNVSTEDAHNDREYDLLTVSFSWKVIRERGGLQPAPVPREQFVQP
ncbi:hypothetical protein MSG28_002389 [Choristoneura fumiferana]|uniref:Uncharacterized protein n=1 Tax=Choristoneura fumiferana TaxID=7141 RepID=A0ACC0JVG0_CHOFU|nr:hypothetical protein MSG28_002389 [Choristoneura fumiferana]